MDRQASPEFESRPLRVVTWNLNHWRQPMLPTDTRLGAWEHLRAMRAGVVLAQEAVPPIDLPRAQAVYGEIGGHRHWGSAVVTLDPSLTVEPIRSVRMPFNRRRYLLGSGLGGAVAVARLTVPGIQPVALVSVYGLWDGPVVSNIFRVIADLLPLFDSPDGARVILGGDLNVGASTLDGHHRARAEAVLASIRALGLIEAKAVAPTRPATRADCPCGQPADCGHIATWGATEIDHLFVSPALAGQVVALSTDPGVIPGGLSDHLPLVLDLALSPGQTPHTWDEEAFAQEIGRRHGSAAAEIVVKLVAWADQEERELGDLAGIRTKTLTRFPTNGVTTEPELWFQVDLDLEPRGVQPTISIRADGNVVVQFGGMRHAPFNTPAGREELRLALNEIDGVDILEADLSRYPTFPLAALVDQSNLIRLVGMLHRIAGETRPSVQASSVAPTAAAVAV